MYIIIYNYLYIYVNSVWFVAKEYTVIHSDSTEVSTGHTLVDRRPVGFHQPQPVPSLSRCTRLPRSKKWQQKTRSNLQHHFWEICP